MPYSVIFRTICNPYIYICTIFRTLVHLEPEMMHIQPHSKTRNYGEGKKLPLPFLKSEKVPSIWKKDPDGVHLLLSFSIQNVVLRASKRKNSEMFPCGNCFSCVLDKMLIEVL